MKVNNLLLVILLGAFSGQILGQDIVLEDLPLSISVKDSRVVVGGINGLLVAFDWDGQHLRRIGKVGGLSCHFVKVIHLDNNGWILGCGSDGTVRYFDERGNARGMAVSSMGIPVTLESALATRGRWKKHNSPPTFLDMAISPQNGWVAVVAEDNNLRLWKVGDKKKPVKEIYFGGVHPVDPMCLSFSLDGKWIAMAGGYSTIVILDVATLSEKGRYLWRPIPRGYDAIVDLAVLDSTEQWIDVLVSSYLTADLAVMRCHLTGNLEQLNIFHNPERPLPFDHRKEYCVALQVLVSSDLQIVGSCESSFDPYRFVSLFNNVGSLWTVGDPVRKIRLWSRDGQYLGGLGDSKSITCAAFSADGKHVFVGSPLKEHEKKPAGGLFRVWSVPQPSVAVAAAKGG